MKEIYKLFLEKHAKNSFTTDKKTLTHTNHRNGDNCLVSCTCWPSGKTEAALPTPCLLHLWKNQESPIQILSDIMPLRALNRDMLRRLEELCKYAKMTTIGVRHGDTSQKEKINRRRLRLCF